MIICDMCKCDVMELVECIEVDVIDDDYTQIKQNGKVFRYCMNCFYKLIIEESMKGE